MHGNSLLLLGCPIKIALFIISVIIFGEYLHINWLFSIILACLSTWIGYPLIVMGAGYLNGKIHFRDEGVDIHRDEPNTEETFDPDDDNENIQAGEDNPKKYHCVFSISPGDPGYEEFVAENDKSKNIYMSQLIEDLSECQDENKRLDTCKRLVESRDLGENVIIKKLHKCKPERDFFIVRNLVDALNMFWKLARTKEITALLSDHFIKGGPPVVIHSISRFYLKYGESDAAEMIVMHWPDLTGYIYQSNNLLQEIRDTLNEALITVAARDPQTLNRIRPLLDQDRYRKNISDETLDKLFSTQSDKE